MGRMVFELGLWLVVVAASAWFLGGAQLAIWALCAFLLCRLVHQTWRISRLEAWLSQSDWRTELSWTGVWAEIAQRIQRQLSQNDKLLLSSEQGLQHFLQAIQASPNGVTLLDAQGRIDWCNATASSHLGIDAKRDIKQHIVHLLRDPVFSHYFAQDQHGAEIVIDGRCSSLTQAIKLSIQLHAYGQGQMLLLSRDITSVILAETMRRDFVANVSHEIRTPLTVLSGFVETMLTLALDESQRQHYLQMMSVQATCMQSLVSDLLTLSRLEGSPPPGDHEVVPLSELMSQVASDAYALSAVLSGQEGGQRRAVHQLMFDDISQVALLGTKSELRSAMSNLVSNAVRYTPPGGTVQVRWQAGPSGGFFSVTDTGPGIASEHVPRLTERFYRVDRSRSRETGGTGLGLAIVKHVAQRHGGELRIESQVAKGSTFTLIFPASRVVTHKDQESP